MQGGSGAVATLDFEGVRGAGQLIASRSSLLDLSMILFLPSDFSLSFHLLNKAVKRAVAQGSLQEPDVQWAVRVEELMDCAKMVVRLANVTGRGKEQVRFTSRIDRIDTDTGIVTPGTPRCVHSDGLIGELTAVRRQNVLLGGPVFDTSDPRQGKFQVHIGVHLKGVSADSLRVLSSDLDKLLSEGVFTDVVLQVKGDETNKGTDIRAHKAVLAARSPFFQRLFMSDMAENRTSTVSVDFPAPVMELLVRFAYTGQLDFGTVETAMSLLGAADYYQLSDLKRLCEEHLLDGVNSPAGRKEVLHTLVLADRYGARALKDAALNVAADRLKTLKQQPEWVEFAKEHPDLVADLVGVLADKLEKAEATLTAQASTVRPADPYGMASPFIRYQ